MKGSSADLANLSRRTAEDASAAVGWFNDNPAQVRQEHASLLREFRKFFHAASKLAVAAERPMCVGVFGPSQSGKSYLLSAFARRGTKPLIVDFDGVPGGLDFGEQINPENQGESTGLVTRFTMRHKPAPAGFPVPVRLLSQADIVKVLGNTVFTNCNLGDEAVPDAAAIASLVDQARAAAQGTDGMGLTEEDVWDIQDYFEQNFKGEAIIRVLSSTGYWVALAELGPRISLDKRAALFSPLWAGIERFTALYVKLTRALDQLGHPPEAFCPIDALVERTHHGFDRRPDSIINVKTLKDLDKVTEPRLEIRGSGGATASLTRPMLTALIAEMHVTMRERAWDFLDNTDLLDFPGLRARKIVNPGTDLRPEQPEPDRNQLGAFEEIFLRGKVAYLFERYKTEQELTSMLLCIAPSNQDVHELPIVVKDWIDVTHGPDPASRATNETALFFIFTKFDTEFQAGIGADKNSSARWTNRLKNTFLEFFGQVHRWPHEWTPNQKFNNCFWLRNPNYEAKHIIDYDEAGAEAGIRPSEVKKLDRMRGEFIANDLVRQHFHNPAEAWDEAFRLNDGGVSYLARLIAPVCNPLIKSRQITTRLDLLRKTMRDRLQRYYVSDDLAEQRQGRQSAARQVVGSLLRCVSAQRFGGLIRQLQITDAELGDVFLNLATRQGVPNGQIIDVGEWEVMFDVKAGGDELKILDAADAYANAAVEHWVETIRSLANNPRVCNHFRVADKAMSDLVDELIAGAARLNLRKRIASEIRPAVGSHRHVRDSVVQLALLAANIIGAFVFWLGYDDVAPEARPVRRENAAMRVFQPRSASDNVELGEEPARFDGRFYSDWFTAYFEFVKLNSESVAGRQIDVVQNERIGKILSELGRSAPATTAS